MIPLLFGATTLAVAVLGWYGYRASIRIAAWGERMNDCDRIIQTVTEETGSAYFEDGRKRIPQDGPRMSPLVTSHR